MKREREVEETCQNSYNCFNQSDNKTHRQVIFIRVLESENFAFFQGLSDSHY